MNVVWMDKKMRLYTAILYPYISDYKVWMDKKMRLYTAYVAARPVS